MYGVIIQARTGSTRLPNKVILPIYKEMKVLEVIIHRLKSLQIPICIATTQNTSDDEIVEIAREWQCHWFRYKEENDVLGRFINAGKFFGWKHIIRVCADNVLIESEFIKELIQWHNLTKSNYVSYKADRNMNGMIVRTVAMLSKTGLFAEIVDLETLEKADDKLSSMEKTNSYGKSYINQLRENVTELIYTGNICKEFYLNSPVDVANIKLSIDTQEDFDLCKKIIDKLGIDCSWREIILYMMNYEHR